MAKNELTSARGMRQSYGMMVSYRYERCRRRGHPRDVIGPGTAGRVSQDTRPMQLLKLCK
jgi:hypothetical protein